MPDALLMRRALALARRGQGLVEPNPMVGCVIARDGKVIGEGFHRRFGGPHAEVEALRDCQARGHDPRGSDVFVTLEPCCHHGKTPPCTDALIAAGPRRVIAAMVDPFPAVAGRGIAALRAAGIDVSVGLEEPAARQLNEPFLKRLATGLPWVIAKWAQTLDGHIATAGGQSKWISNEASRLYVHRVRACVDAVVIGIGTALADDPRLTARGVPLRRTARRVVIDPSLRLPETAALLAPPAPPKKRGHPQLSGRQKSGDLASNKEGCPLFLTLGVRQELLDKPSDKLRRLRDRGVEFFGLTPLIPHADATALALRPLLVHLAAAHQATNVLVEGGATLFGHLFGERLIDEVLAFIAPKILGDAQALPAVRGLGGASDRPNRQARTLSLRTIQRFDDDVLCRYLVGDRITT